MPDYRISVGNSTTGPVGFVARITAESPTAALELLKAYMPEYAHILTEAIQMTAYFNPDAITEDDVEEDT